MVKVSYTYRMVQITMEISAKTKLKDWVYSYGLENFITLVNGKTIKCMEEEPWYGQMVECMREGIETFDSSYFEGKKHGSGTFTYKDGKRYVG